MLPISAYDEVFTELQETGLAWLTRPGRRGRVTPPVPVLSVGRTAFRGPTPETSPAALRLQISKCAHGKRARIGRHHDLGEFLVQGPACLPKVNRGMHLRIEEMEELFAAVHKLCRC